MLYAKAKEYAEKAEKAKQARLNKDKLVKAKEAIYESQKELTKR